MSVKEKIEDAGQATKEAAEKAGQKIKEGADVAADKAADAAKATGDAVKNTGQKIKETIMTWQTRPHWEASFLFTCSVGPRWRTIAVLHPSNRRRWRCRRRGIGRRRSLCGWIVRRDFRWRRRRHFWGRHGILLNRSIIPFMGQCIRRAEAKLLPFTTSPIYRLTIPSGTRYGYRR